MKVYKSYIGRQLFIMATIPAIVIGIIITYMSTRVVYNVKLDDTKDFLKSSIAALEFNYDFMSFSDSEFYEDENGIVYFRGDKVSDKYEIVDMSKEFTGAEVSLFYENKRIATTIMRSDGSRFTNTTADEVWNNYCSKSEDYFDTKVIINDEEYFGYYIPIVSDEGRAVGMLFAGLPSATVHNTIHEMNQNAIMIFAFLCIVVFVIAVLQTNKVLKVVNSVLGYMSDINNENFRHDLANNVIKRNDEFGRIGRQLVELNDSLQSSVENDMLTGLYNRRVAMKKLDEYVVWANGKKDDTFTFAICDIDHFKNVNDTYGHSCGDLVLKAVANVLLQVDEQEGFAARWGGEEFIIVLKKPVQEAIVDINKIADEIRNIKINFEDNIVSITMTFGVAEYTSPQKIDFTISTADKLLYKGKENGRDKVVF
ncbi:MAG: diguanylate cyclase [Clostridium sp.]|nr:diguanylate cyclase [Clostridium sp.]MCM1172647.1 diguanylate cyclase [Clostridium sp.]MCM1207692.1 diguanylate cyclase [Ruminococcus sp.]